MEAWDKAGNKKATRSAREYLPRFAGRHTPVQYLTTANTPCNIFCGRWATGSPKYSPSALDGPL